jgi:hypothetical protein
MRRPASVAALEALGRVRLSRSFFMRDFLYSEVSQVERIPNIPDDPDAAIAAGKRLCEDLLEPLNGTFAGIAIRSAYRSAGLNSFCNRMQREGKQGYSCASNDRNYGRHIWDKRDASGCIGATACIVIPWFADRYEKGADWRQLAYWIHDHLPYSELQFFPKLAAFNISWREKPKREIHSFVKPKGCLVRGEAAAGKYTEWYTDFPPLRREMRL